MNLCVLAAIITLSLSPLFLGIYRRVPETLAQNCHQLAITLSVLLANNNNLPNPTKPPDKGKKEEEV
jgi:hypothetical protein